MGINTKHTPKIARKIKNAALIFGGQYSLDSDDIVFTSK
jgi:hypothetical protein